MGRQHPLVGVRRGRRLGPKVSPGIRAVGRALAPLRRRRRTEHRSVGERGQRLTGGVLRAPESGLGDARPPEHPQHAGGRCVPSGDRRLRAVHALEAAPGVSHCRTPRNGPQPTNRHELAFFYSPSPRACFSIETSQAHLCANHPP